jgi:hypothetical protein
LKKRRRSFTSSQYDIGCNLSVLSRQVKLPYEYIRAVLHVFTYCLQSSCSSSFKLLQGLTCVWYLGSIHTYIRIRLYPQTLCCGHAVRAHVSATKTHTETVNFWKRFPESGEPETFKNATNTCVSVYQYVISF